MKRQLILYCLLPSISFTVSAKQPQVFNDPFAASVLKKFPHTVSNQSGLKAKTSSWLPKLTSTLRAGKNSMIIISGQVIKVGEFIEGYKLIKVNERSAVFVKNHKKTRLTLDDNE